LESTRNALLTSALSIAASVAACTIKLPADGPLTIRVPAEGDSLIAGDTFRVLADFDIEAPQYHLEYFLVELSDVSTGYAISWEVDAPANNEPRILDASFHLPAEAPPGNDYRLSVSAHPGIGQGESALAIGNSIEISVSAPP
jgi:hypothetical protein